MAYFLLDARQFVVFWKKGYNLGKNLQVGKTPARYNMEERWLLSWGN
jgi:hypothetical protein